MLQARYLTTAQWQKILKQMSLWFKLANATCKCERQILLVESNKHTSLLQHNGRISKFLVFLCKVVTKI
jgi:hypothetical protein